MESQKPRAGGLTRLRRFLNAMPPTLRRQKLLSALWRLGIVSPIQYMAFNGNAKAWVDLRDSESRATYLSQSFWPEFPPMVAAFLRNGGDFFDVGANFGLVTFATVPLMKGAGTKFHLFEANDRIIPLIERSAREWPEEELSINHCCVSDERGVSLHLLPDEAWGHGHIADRGTPVPNVLLDDYIAERRVERISFLKLDVEGWEIRALHGARRALASGRVEAGFIEVSPETLRRAGAEAGELLDLLQHFGFDAYFAGLWDEGSSGPSWACVSVNGTAMRFSPAAPLPADFVQGDVLVVHRTTALAPIIRSAVRK